ncbi:hypothetical protein ACQ4PT_009384 [Festuca glaucescens]
MDVANDANREMELQLATIETEDGDQHGSPTPSPSPTPSLDGALRLRAPGKGLVPGQRPAPPASGSNAQNRGGSTPVTSGTRGRPPLSAAAKHKNKSKAVTTCVTVDEISAPMDVDGGHVVISDDEDEQEEDVVAVNGAGKRKKTSNVWLEMKEVKVKGEYKARFIYVPAPHTANVICQELYDSLLEWNIDEKLMTVTVDNCTTNDKAIEMIVRKIGKNKLPLEGILLHMRCCAHILNLIVKDGLDVMKSAIVNIRESVAYWTATGKE